ncbi:MAG: 30S ribosomal protein S4, partial [Patescibacteria group bacterium]
MPPFPSKPGSGKPGAGKKQRRLSEYGKRLVAKQEAKKEYGLRERQFRRYFDLARTVRGATGEKLLELLERRIDNVLYRLDLAQTRAQARQLISHGHVCLQGKKMNIPSYQVQVGEEIVITKETLIHPRGVDVA